jgi:hypothetical protein
MFISGVNDTGDKLFRGVNAGINNTGEQLSPVTNQKA